MTLQGAYPTSPPDVITQQELMAAAQEQLMNSEDDDEEQGAATEGTLRTKTADWRSPLGTRVMLELEARVPPPAKSNKRAVLQRGTGLIGELTPDQLRALLNNTAIHWALDIDWLHRALADLQPMASTAGAAPRAKVRTSSVTAAAAASRSPPVAQSPSTSLVTPTQVSTPSIASPTPAAAG